MRGPSLRRGVSQGLCLDAAYDNRETRELLANGRFEAHIRSCGEEIKLKAHMPGWPARRWVVEAAHSWLNRNRALLIRCSKKAATTSRCCSSPAA